MSGQWSWTDSFSNITGQISDIARDVLVEGTEEVDDHATALKVSQSNITQIRERCDLITAENERLKEEAVSQHENVQSAEIQLQAVSNEYSQILRKKEAEIAVLKETHAELSASHSKLVESQNVSGARGHSHYNSLKSATSDYGLDQEGGSSGSELDELVSSQKEIGRLEGAVRALELENRRLGQAAKASTKESQSVSSPSVDEQLAKLRLETKTFRDKLLSSKSEHQEEVSALQDVHSSQLSRIRAEHRKALDSLRQDYEEDRSGEGWNSSQAGENAAKATAASLSAALDAATARIRELEKEVESAQSSHQPKSSTETRVTDSEVSADSRTVQGGKSSPSPEQHGTLGSYGTISSKDDSSTSRLSVLVDQVTALQSRIDQYEQEEEQYQGLTGSGWVTDGSRPLSGSSTSLNSELASLRSQLGSKEQELLLLQAQQGLAAAENHALFSSPADMFDTFPDEDPIGPGHSKGQRSHQVDSDDDGSEIGSDLAENVQEIHEKVELLTQANSELEAERDSLSLEKENLVAQLSTLRLADTQKQQKIEHLTQAATEAETSLVDLEKERDFVFRQLEEAREDRAADASVGSTGADDVGNLRADNEALEKSLVDLDEQHEVVVAQLMASRDDFSNRLKEALSKMEENGACLAAENDDLLKALEEEKEANKTKTEELSMSLNDLHMRKEELLCELKKSKENSASLADKLQASSTEMRSELGSAEARSSDLESICEKQRATISQLKMDFDKLKLESGAVEKACSELSAANDALTERNSELLGTVTDLKDMYAGLEVSKADLSVKEESLQKTVDSLEQQVLHLRQEQDSQDPILDQSYGEEIGRLEASLREREAEIDELQAHLQSINSSIASDSGGVGHNYSTASSMAMSPVTKSFLASSEGDDSVMSLRNRLAESERSLAETRELLTTSLDGQKPLEDLVREREKEANDMNKQQRSLEAQLADSEKCVRRVVELEESLAESERHLVATRGENRRLMGEVEALKEQVANETKEDPAQAQALLVMTEMEREIGMLKKEARENDGRLGEHEVEIDKLRTQLKARDEESVEEAAKTAVLQGTVKDVADELREKEQKLEEAVKEKSEVESALNTIRGEREADVAQLSQAVKDREENIMELSRQVTDMSAKYAESQKLVDSVCKAGEASQIGASPQVGDTLVLNGPTSRSQEEDEEGASDEMKSLKRNISDRERTICELRASNASLLRMLETRDAGEHSLVHQYQLETELRSAKSQVEQMRAVLSDKTRETSNLKSEVHRLMGVIGAERAAISRLQGELQQKDAENSSGLARNTGRQDMSAEAVQKLAGIIQDKDIVMEALSRKCETLTSLLQQQPSSEASGSSPSASHSPSAHDATSTPLNESLASPEKILSLVNENRSLTEEIARFRADRDQLTAAFSAKHTELVTYYQRIQELSEYARSLTARVESADAEKETALQQAANAVREGAAAREELLSARQQCVLLEGRLVAVEAETRRRRISESGRSSVSGSDHGSVVGAGTASEGVVADDGKDGADELRKSLATKSRECDLAKDSVKNLEGLLRQQTIELETARSQNTSLNKALESNRLEGARLKESLSALKRESEEETARSQTLRETVGPLTAKLQESQLLLQASDQKSATLSQLVNERSTAAGDEVQRRDSEIQSLLSRLEAGEQAARQAAAEKAGLLAAVQSLQVQIQTEGAEKVKLKGGVSRLQAHLIEIEGVYTADALEAEAREKDLRDRLSSAELLAANSSTVVAEASERANRRVTQLEEDSRELSRAHDDALIRLAASQEQTQQYAQQLANLQGVLQQFQQERDAMHAAEIRRFKAHLTEQAEAQVESERLIGDLREEVKGHREALEGAKRLSEQLDRRQEELDDALSKASSLESANIMLNEKFRELRTSVEGKVDKQIIKNLLLGYLTASAAKRLDVLKIISKVLGFDHDESVKAHLESSLSPSTWRRPFSGLWNRLAPPSSPSASGEQHEGSFSELFVKFLENESTPKKSLSLPVDRMIEDEQRKQHTLHQKAIARGGILPNMTSSPLLANSSSAVGSGAFNPFTSPAITAAQSNTALQTVPSSLSVPPMRPAHGSQTLLGQSRDRTAAGSTPNALLIQGMQGQAQRGSLWNVAPQPLALLSQGSVPVSSPAAVVTGGVSVSSSAFVSTPVVPLLATPAARAAGADTLSRGSPTIGGMSGVASNSAVTTDSGVGSGRSTPVVASGGYVKNPLLG